MVAGHGSRNYDPTLGVAPCAGRTRCHYDDRGAEHALRRGRRSVKQVEQNYRSGRLRVAEVPAPRSDDGSLLVATRVSLISAGTERQLVNLARASLAGKAVARPDLVRRVMR